MLAECGFEVVWSENLGGNEVSITQVVDDSLVSDQDRCSGEHSIWTTAAIGFLAYYCIVMWHELLGHGTVMYLLGARHFLLTSTSLDTTDLGHHMLVTTGDRFVSMAGSWSNILLGITLYPLFKVLFQRGTNLALCLFLWLVSAVGVFIGCIYPVYSGIFGVGDWADAIAQLPHHALLRGLEIVVGTILCLGSARFFAVSFGKFPEDLRRLSLIPYFSAALIFSVAGLRIPNGTHLMLISVIPAALMGQSMLLFVVPLARRLRQGDPSMQTIPTSLSAILIGGLFVVVILLTAPGVYFSIP